MHVVRWRESLWPLRGSGFIIVRGQRRYRPLSFVIRTVPVQPLAVTTFEALTRCASALCELARQIGACWQLLVHTML